MIKNHNENSSKAPEVFNKQWLDFTLNCEKCIPNIFKDGNIFTNCPVNGCVVKEEQKQQNTL